MGSQSPWDTTEHTLTHTHTHTQVLATTMVIIILQYINMSDQHILHLKLTQSKMLLYLNKTYIKCKSLSFHHKRNLPTQYKNSK